MAYSLANSYAGESLLSGFNWFDGADPSHGFVAYQTRDNAEAKGLYSVDPDTQVVRLGVDFTNTYPLSQGRPSIRLESKEAYNHGLFIADFLHMPPSQCGLWPAFWSYGTDWPSGGEVDIIEGGDTAHNNIISAHTADGCTQDSSLDNMFTGIQRNTECAVGEMNIGCGFNPPVSDTTSYGDGFNAVNGGVYAMKWDSKHISVWHFPRGAIPADIESKTPHPAGWGKPQAVFGGPSCDVDSYWKNMKIVVNTNFCGDYGNAIWGKSDTCTDVAPTCEEYVANYPQAFTNAYWDVRYIDAYQLQDGSSDSGNDTASGAAIAAPAPPLTSPASFPNNTGSRPTADGSSSDKPTSNKPSINKPAADEPTTNEPSDTKKPVNPAQVGDYAYLGCFGSSTGFQTFDKTGEDKEMTLERCVKMCDGIKYAGVVMNKCYCADSLDADTRAGATEDMCDHSCPGNNTEFCGGIVPAPSDKPTHRVGGLKQGGGPINLTSDGAGNMANPVAPMNITDEAKPAGNETFMATLRRNFRRGAPNTYVLTVYGAVAKDKPLPAPAMAPVLINVTETKVITNTAFRTVIPLQKTVQVERPEHKKLQANYEKYIATMTVTEDCDEHEATTGMSVPVAPMATTVLPCESCGPNGENKVTMTVPVANSSVETSARMPTASVVMGAAAGGWEGTKLSAVLGLVVLVIAMTL